MGFFSEPFNLSPRFQSDAELPLPIRRRRSSDPTLEDRNPRNTKDPRKPRSSRDRQTPQRCRSEPTRNMIAHDSRGKGIPEIPSLGVVLQTRSVIVLSIRSTLFFRLVRYNQSTLFFDLVDDLPPRRRRRRRYLSAASQTRRCISDEADGVDHNQDM